MKNSDDCDDSDFNITYGWKFYLDNDKDGYGVRSSSIIACFAPEGYANNSYDCDDDNP